MTLNSKMFIEICLSGRFSVFEIIYDSLSLSAGQ